MLISEDLPTLDRPTIASSGLPSCGHWSSEALLQRSATLLTCSGLGLGSPGGMSGASCCASVSAPAAEQNRADAV
jgi:hypothetical protein